MYNGSVIDCSEIDGHASEMLPRSKVRPLETNTQNISSISSTYNFMMKSSEVRMFSVLQTV